MLHRKLTRQRLDIASVSVSILGFEKDFGLGRVGISGGLLVVLWILFIVTIVGRCEGYGSRDDA